MSNLLRSKSLLGITVVGIVVALALVAFATVASAAYMHTATLKMGSTGTQVMSLQQTLNAAGFLVSASGAGAPGMESTYFGAKTKAAVMAFQSSKGLSVDGVVGPMTGAALAMVGGTTGGSTGGSTVPGCLPGYVFSPTTGASCTGGSTGGSTGGTTGGLTGGAGDITVTATSDFGDEEVGEDEADVEVLGFEIEADDNSDVEITSVKVELAQQTAVDSENLTDYAESVSVMMNGEVVGSADAEDFSENNDDWTKSINLDGAVVEAGEEVEFSLAVTALGNLDSGDIDSDDWQIGISSIRFVDGEGVVSTDSLTLDIDDNVVDDTLEEEFDFASFATAADVELKAALNDDEDDVNEAHIINIDDTDNTDGVEILAFTLEAEGSDVNIDDIAVKFTTTEAAGTDFDDPADVLASTELWFNGAKVGTESFTDAGSNDTETITFDDLDVDIDEGDTGEFVVKVDVQDLATVLDEGDTLKAELTGTEVDLIDAQDESGEDLVAADLTGTALGEASAFYDTGIMVDFVSADATRSAIADATGESDTGDFTIVFDVTAFEADMRIDKSCETDNGSNAAGQGVVYDETISATDTTGWTVSCLVSSSSTDSEDTANVYEVDEDTTRRFTLTVSATPDEDSFVEILLENINWGTATDNTNANYYSFNLADFKTDPLFLNDM